LKLRYGNINRTLSQDTQHFSLVNNTSLSIICICLEFMCLQWCYSVSHLSAYKYSWTLLLCIASVQAWQFQTHICCCRAIQLHYWAMQIVFLIFKYSVYAKNSWRLFIYAYNLGSFMRDQSSAAIWLYFSELQLRCNLKILRRKSDMICLYCVHTTTHPILFIHSYNYTATWF
jgi:hypothetical protein